MVAQIREVLQRYADAGGWVRTEVFEGSGHFPVADSGPRFREVFLDFLASAG
jgi:pimeloyl-ACP methyl ester carboxylesterase